MTAIKSRWDAEGLDDTIAKLYPAGDSPKKPGAPPLSPLPRAEYRVMIPNPQVKTRNSRVYQAVVEFSVWATGTATLAGYLAAIHAAFVNADADGMTMANGTILEVDDGGSTIDVADDKVFIGEKRITIRHSLSN